MNLAFKQRLRIGNDSSRPLELLIEPISEKIIIPPKGLIQIEAGFDESDLVRIDYAESSFTLHGWVHTVSSVGDDGSLRPLWSLDPPEDGE